MTAISCVLPCCSGTTSPLALMALLLFYPLPCACGIHAADSLAVTGGLGQDVGSGMAGAQSGAQVRAQAGPQARHLIASRCKGACSTYGTCNEELGRCDCLKNMTGDECNKVAEGEAFLERCVYLLFGNTKECAFEPQACLNNCNMRGSCVSGFCHCQPGHYGADCSLSLGSNGRPVLLAGSGYETRKKRPHVYVYELPPNMTSWINTKRLDRPTHLLLGQRLLSSGARVADGDDADWFFIPVQRRGVMDTMYLTDAVDYIRKHYPWWDRYGGGHRHFVIHTGDLGKTESKREALPLMENVTWMTHWGLTEEKKISHWRAAHVSGRDIVIPVYVSPGHFAHFGFDRSPVHPNAVSHSARQQTLFFAGRICADRKPPDANKSWPHCGGGLGYSAGVRQMVHYYHHNRSGYRIVEHDDSYSHQLTSTKYCLAPLGGGHGQRQIQVAFMGCIPVTIGDHVMQPFEPELNWSLFSVQPLELEVERLHEILDSINEEQLKKMQAALSCAAQHFVYSSITGGFLGPSETGRYDAFEAMLEILRARVDHPGIPPQQLASVDPEFNRFMNCGADYMGGPAVEDIPQTGLCSHSQFDGSPPSCYTCVRGIPRTHGVPGGAICCMPDGTHQADLAKCPRPWV